MQQQHLNAFFFFFLYATCLRGKGATDDMQGAAGSLRPALSEYATLTQFMLNKL
jgi:hypothetical protein